MTTLKLVGRDIHDAEQVVQAKFERFSWNWYDAVITEPDEIDAIDFAITIAMNSRATASRLREFMVRKEALDRLLRAVPRDLNLSSATPDAVFDAVRLLFEEACRAPGTALAVASKVLHRKRPKLIPMLDRVVVDHHYWLAVQTLATSPEKQPAWFDSTWLKHGAWSDPTVYMRIMALEIDQNANAIREIRRSIPAEILPAEASDVRILEAALYGDLQRMNGDRDE